MNTFGIINMNARLYDPALGRFLAPDPVVTDPSCLLDFNRYMYARNNPMLYTDLNGESFKDWWKKNIADPWKRDWNKFNSGFDGGTVGFSTSGRVSFTPNYYGRPVGPAVGLDFNKNQATFGGYQNGFFNMQSVNYETNLQHAVIGAEQSAKIMYDYNQPLQSFANHSSYFDIAATGFEINQMALKPYLYYASEFSDYTSLYKNLGNTGRMMGTLGTIAGGASLVVDYNTMQNGDMSASRFGYHATSFGVSVAIGAAVGNVPGAVAGGMFWSGEVLYDKMVVPVFDWYWQLENGLRTFPQRFSFPY